MDPFFYFIVKNFYLRADALKPQIEIVEDFAYDQHIKNDIFPSSNGGNDVSPSYVEVYLNKFSQYEKTISKKKVSRKTVPRIASENSLISTTSYLMTIADSNSIEGKIPKDHPSNTKLGTIFSELIPIVFYVGACCWTGVMVLLLFSSHIYLQIEYPISR